MTSNARGQNHLAGIIAIVVAMQVIAFSDAAAKWLSMSLPLLVVIWGRFFFHALFAGVYVGVKHGARALNPALSKILLARGAALFCAVGLLYATYQRIPLATGLTLWFIEPFILTLLCLWWLKEKVSGAQWTAIGIGFAGVVIAIKPAVAPFDIAYITGLCAGVFYALFLFATKYIEDDMPPLVSVFHTGLIGAVAATVIVVFDWPASGPSAREWALLMFTGAVAAVAHIFVIRAFEKTDAAVIAPYTYSEIIMAAVLGYIADSTRKCNSWLDAEEYLIWRFHAKTFSRAVVQFVHDGAKVAPGHSGEVRSLREILPNQAIAVFVCSPLPRSVGMCKVELRPQCLGDGAMFGKLPPVVRGQRVNMPGQRPQKAHDSLADCIGAFARHLSNHRQAGLSLAQGNQRPLVVFADDGVKFPVSQATTALNNGGTFVNKNPAWQLTPAAVAPIALPALLAAAKVQMQITPETLVMANVALNPLVADPAKPLLRQPQTDLFRAPVLAQQGFNPAPVLRRQSRLRLALPALDRKALRLLRALAAPAAVAPQLPADCGLVDADNVGNLGLVASRFHQGVNLVSLLLGKLRIMSHGASPFC